MVRPVEIGRDTTQSVVLLPKQRQTHLHIIGPSQSGKTRLIEHLIKQDIQAGHGLCVLDPTGALYKRLAKWCAARGMHRRRKLHFFDPNDDNQIIGFNPLLRQPGDDVSKRVDATVLACARAWGEDPSSTPLLKRCLRSIFTALIEHDLTLMEGLELIMPPATKEEKELNSFLTRVSNPYVQRSWEQFKRMDPRRFEETFGSTNNRLADFLSSERMTRIFGFGAGSLDLRTCMDQGHMLFVNLQPDKISLDNSKLLGTLITNELLQLARGRDNAMAEKRPFYCYVDEAYKYLTDDIEQAIDETRQKGLHYILAHQRLSQLRDAGPNIYGGVMSIRNKVIFGDLEPEDTEVLAEDLFQRDYDENEEVEVLRKPVTVGHEIRRNRQYREGQGTGRAEQAGETKARSLVDASNSAVNLPFDVMGMLTGDLTEGGGVATAKGQSRAINRAITINESKTLTEGWAESLAPLLEERPGAVRSYDEQMKIFAKALKSIPPQTAHLKLRGCSAMLIQIPYVGDPVTHDRRLSGFYQQAGEQSQFTFAMTEVIDRLLRRRGELLRRARAADGEPMLDTPDDFLQ